MSGADPSDLARRIRDATGADRELDALLDCLLGRRLWSFNPRMTVPADEADHYERTEDRTEGVPLMVADHPAGEWAVGPNGRSVVKNPRRRTPPPYTASIDAAVGLVERMLPGVLSVEFSYETDDNAVWPAATVRWYPRGKSGKDWHASVAGAPTIALALLSVLLDALSRANNDASAPASDSDGEGEHGLR